MNRVGTPMRIAVSVAAFLASLSLVAWRQGRAYEVMSALDHARDEISLAQAERSDLQSDVQAYQSRAWVLPQARERLGMHVADAGEMVMLAGTGK